MRKFIFIIGHSSLPETRFQPVACVIDILSEKETSGEFIRLSESQISVSFHTDKQKTLPPPSP